jgi:hypothetical protein
LSRAQLLAWFAPFKQDDVTPNDRQRIAGAFVNSVYVLDGSLINFNAKDRAQRVSLD